MMECILAGGLWLPERIHSIKPEVPSTCPLCQLTGCGPRHLFWDCIAKQLTAIPAVQESQHLMIKADQYKEYDCLWLRGLLPSHLTTVKHAVPATVNLHYCGRQPPYFWPACTYYTDGTGGVFSSKPEARRCGVGIAVLDGLKMSWGCCLALPGEHQTVPASGLFAVLLVVAPPTAAE